MNQLSNYRVALIDDDPVFREMIAVSGRSQGLKVETFASIAQVGYFKRFERYHIIALDFDLSSSLNGLEIGRYIRSVLANTPIVLVSSDANVVNEIRNSDWIVSEFLPKSGVNEVCTRLKELCDQAASQNVYQRGKYEE